MMLRQAWRALAVLIALGATASVASAQNAETHEPAAPGASVYFESPTDGAVIGQNFTVRAGLRGMGVAPAGETAPHSGHHHLLIDSPVIRPDEPLPVNNRVVHFSNGETEVQLSLPPGRHKLQLVLGDAGHMTFKPSVASKVITVLVKKR